jgi:hypothetical protein
MKYHYVWFLWSSAFLIPWAILYMALPVQRRVMLRASLLTMPFGLTEPLFVPEYWSPPSLFDLAQQTGFDVESLIFCFALGGLGVVLYNGIARTLFVHVPAEYRRLALHRRHAVAIAAPAIVFPVLYLLPWNPIYPAILAMLAGAIANVLCRPELGRKTWIGGLLFLALYALFIGALPVIVPGYIDEVWNAAELSGIDVWAVPLEEYFFGFAFGVYWAGVYEHLSWRRPSGAPQVDRTLCAMSGDYHWERES